MRINNWSGLYGFGYVLVSFGVYGFYKRFEIKGKENIPIGKPILFAANHQNAFLDGAIIGYAISKPIYFLGRADIFKKKMAKWALGGFNCLPIFRERDGADYLLKNEEVFEKFYDVLAKNHPIVIFPEGSHAPYKYIRGPLKKGVFRIGVGAEKKYDTSLDVYIVPVGIEYEKHSKMGGDLLLTFGESIRVQDHMVSDQLEQEKEYAALVPLLEKRLSNLIIDVKEQDYYDFIMSLERMFLKEIIESKHKSDRNLTNKLLAQKAFIRKAEKYIVSDSENAKDLQALEQDFTSRISEFGLRSWLFQKERHPIKKDVTVLIVFSPFYIYGLLTNYLPYQIANGWVDKKVKDVNFHASIKVIVGALSFLIYWIFLVIIVAYFTDNCLWVYCCISLPLSAIFSQYYGATIIKLRGKIKFNKIMSVPSEIEKNLRNQYETLKKCFQSIYSAEE
jgi:1-acyl-sn-glycerol-3-phosphate acyltransferase